MGVLEERQVADANWRKRVDETLEEHMERLDAHDEKFERGNRRFTEGEERMTRLEAKLDDNNSMTAAIQGSTAQLVTWATNVTGFRNVVTGLGKLVVWLSIVIIAVGVIYWAMKTGDLPHKAEAFSPMAGILIRRRPTQPALQVAGTARPSMPVSVFAEDFSLLIRTPRRMRIARNKIRVLH